MGQHMRTLAREGCSGCDAKWFWGLGVYCVTEDAELVDVEMDTAE